MIFDLLIYSGDNILLELYLKGMKYENNESNFNFPFVSLFV